LGYTVAKVPVYCNVLLADLVHKYGAVNIVPHLMDFLLNSPITSHSVPAPILTSTLSVYKCITIHLPPAPQVTLSITKDVVQARPFVATRGLVSAIPAQFNTVLAWESAEVDSIEHPLDGEYMLVYICHHLALLIIFFCRSEGLSGPSYL
jgi:hypothetical protein